MFPDSQHSPAIAPQRFSHQPVSHLDWPGLDNFSRDFYETPSYCSYMKIYEEFEARYQPTKNPFDDLAANEGT